MYKETHILLNGPKENDSRSEVQFAWLPTTYVLESDGERTITFFWLKYYEVIERFRNLYSWKASQNSFYEWYSSQWCLEKVHLITKEEYRARTRGM